MKTHSELNMDKTHDLKHLYTIGGVVALLQLVSVLARDFFKLSKSGDENEL